MNFADCVAGLGIGGGGYRAGIKDYDVGRRRVEGKRAALFAELPLDGRTVGLCGATAELFDKEGAHRGGAKVLFKHTRAPGHTDLPEKRFTAG